MKNPFAPLRLMRYMLLKEFIPFLFLGVLFFTLILVMGDIFTNLWRYLNRDIPFSKAIMVSLLYAPRALTFALPIGAMFAAAFSLGILGSRNELIAVFTAGVPLVNFVRPMLLVALIFSVGGYFFEDQVAIPLMRTRKQLSDELLGVHDSSSRSRAVAIARQGKVVYLADYYNDEQQKLTGLTVIILDENNRFSKRIDAEEALWSSKNELWTLISCRSFTEEAGEVSQERSERLSLPVLNEPPSTFRLDTRELDEMNRAEASSWIETQKRAGLPYKAFQAEYYQRFTMACTPFLVVFFAGALGNRFRKNILLMCLLASLGLSSAWYIVRMMSTLLSELGILSPLVGAVVPYAGFLALGIWLFRHAKT